MSLATCVVVRHETAADSSTSQVPQSDVQGSKRCIKSVTSDKRGSSYVLKSVRQKKKKRSHNAVKGAGTVRMRSEQGRGRWGMGEKSRVEDYSRDHFVTDVSIRINSLSDRVKHNNSKWSLLIILWGLQQGWSSQRILLKKPTLKT